MWKDIKNWWDRKWSAWEQDSFIHDYTRESGDTPVHKYLVLKSKSNDGLVRFKRVKQW